MFFFFFLRIKWKFNDGKVISMVESIKGFEINCSGVIANYEFEWLICLDQTGDVNFILLRFDSLDNQW